jgi:hypothetical protein
MHLKHARDKGKLDEFFAEKAKTHPKASRVHFHGTLKSMVARTVKPKRRTSRKGSSGD